MILWLREKVLVGYVSEVGPSYAKVTTILSPDLNVGAVEIRTKDTGNITGSVETAAKGLTQLELLPKDTQVKAGDIVVTAGTSGFFPQDIIIGVRRRGGSGTFRHHLYRC